MPQLLTTVGHHHFRLTKLRKVRFVSHKCTPEAQVSQGCTGLPTGESTLMTANPEVIALVEQWLHEFCPQTVDIKTVHIFAKLAELSIYNFRDKKAAECHPGRAFLGALVGWSVTKVSRATGKLKSFGVLRSFQPRLFDKEKGKWIPLTSIYSIPFLGRIKIRQLAAILKVKLPARMHSNSSFLKKVEDSKRACVQPPNARFTPVAQVAKTVFNRLMGLATKQEPEREIRTGNVARDKFLNRFARLGRAGG